MANGQIEKKLSETGNTKNSILLLLFPNWEKTSFELLQEINKEKSPESTISHQFVSKTLSELCEQGIVASAKLARDKRSIYYFLTQPLGYRRAVGVSIFKKIQDFDERELTAFLEAFKPILGESKKK